MEAVPGGANYWDLGLREGHVRALLYMWDQESGVEVERDVDFPIPEETMDQLEKLLGDGNSTVTVGKEFKVSENYKTVGCTCWVKLTCNQDLESLLSTRELGESLALAFAEHGFEMSQYVMDQMQGKKVKQPPPLELSIVGEEEEEDKDPEPDRKQKKSGKKTRPLKGKPSFRR